MVWQGQLLANRLFSVVVALDDKMSLYVNYMFSAYIMKVNYDYQL